MKGTSRGFPGQALDGKSYGEYSAPLWKTGGILPVPAIITGE